jgi:hypothetical protein
VTLGDDLGDRRVINDRTGAELRVIFPDQVLQLKISTTARVPDRCPTRPAGLRVSGTQLRHDETGRSRRARRGISVELLVLGVVVWLVSWAVSLRLNPWVKCSKCGGQPKKQGAFYSYAHHSCDKCGGKGQQVRFGRRLFNMGPGRP